MLNNGGAMFIEDVQKEDFFSELEEKFNEVAPTLEGKFICETVDLRDIKDRYDDLIFVIKRVDE